MATRPINSGNSSETLEEYVSKMDVKLSDRTKREYTNRLKDLTRKIKLGDNALKPQMLATSLAAIAADKTLSPASFRLYKSASVYWLGQQAQAMMGASSDYGEYAQAYDALRKISITSPHRERRTSSKKLKYFPEDCRLALAKFVKERGHRAPNAVRANAYVEANLLVGLRPAEWFDANFASYFVRDEQGNIRRDAQNRALFEHMLVVDNAKNTHGRGNGPTRELILHGISTKELMALAHFREIAVKFKARHPADIDEGKLTELLYRPMNNMIRRALSTSGFAAHDIPSCYSTRHQLVANFKATPGLTKREIAAFFGHSSGYTHQEHYGHKVRGQGGTKFRASPESVARVNGHTMLAQPEIISPQLAAEIEQWATEQGTRMAP